jgi:hypothetical protein
LLAFRRQPLRFANLVSRFYLKPDAQEKRDTADNDRHKRSVLMPRPQKICGDRSKYYCQYLKYDLNLHSLLISSFAISVMDRPLAFSPKRTANKKGWQSDKRRKRKDSNHKGNQTKRKVQRRFKSPIGRIAETV